MDPLKVKVEKIEEIFKLDPYLKPFEHEIRRRYLKMIIEYIHKCLNRDLCSTYEYINMYINLCNVE